MLRAKNIRKELENLFPQFKDNYGNLNDRRPSKALLLFKKNIKNRLVLLLIQFLTVLK